MDSQIRAKIGDKIYAQVKKYFIDEDEKLLFYAGGIDSLTAVDYIACTNNQLIFRKYRSNEKVNSSSN